MPGFSKTDGGPQAGDVHVNGPDWRPRGKAKAGITLASAPDDQKAAISKAAPDPSPLYVSRNVENAGDLIAWAKKQGFDTTLPADELHVTVAYSRVPVDWMAAGESWSGDPGGKITVKPGGPRQLAAFGPTGDAAVLLFACNDLKWRHDQLLDMGCSWDWGGYSPHITISFAAPAGLDLSKLQPYQGEIVLGPEIFAPLVDDWKDSLVEKSFEAFFKVAGVDEALGLVFGWGIVCKEDDADYYDSQKNHIPEHAMVVATTDFMKSARVHGDMHVRGTTAEMPAGVVVHSFPLTTEIAKAMGIETKKTGWMVATAPDPAMLAKFASGEYTGFSIGGDYLEIDGKPVGAGQ